jgi:hypothetical protein
LGGRDGLRFARTDAHQCGYNEEQAVDIALIIALSISWIA